MNASKKLVGTILTSTTRLGFNVRGPRGEYIVETSGALAGGARSHLQQVQEVARTYFGHGVLKAIRSTELPSDVTEAWGMTEQEGSVSVKVTHYQVWQ